MSILTDHVEADGTNAAGNIQYLPDKQCPRYGDHALNGDSDQSYRLRSFPPHDKKLACNSSVRQATDLPCLPVRLGMQASMDCMTYIHGILTKFEQRVDRKY